MAPGCGIVAALASATRTRQKSKNPVGSKEPHTFKWRSEKNHACSLFVYILLTGSCGPTKTREKQHCIWHSPRRRQSRSVLLPVSTNAVFMQNTVKINRDMLRLIVGPLNGYCPNTIFHEHRVPSHSRGARQKQ